MPELPEVETVKNALACFVINLEIKEIVINQHCLRNIIPANLPQIFANSKILRVYRRAKFIIMDCDNEKSLIIHLGMSGKIRFNDKNFQKHDHIVIYCSQNKSIIYNDSRRFGVFDFCRTEDVHKSNYLKGLGIEPFDVKLTPQFLINALKNKKIPIKQAIMDQKIITGIGNIYACEILFKAKISPLRSADSLKIKEAQNLIEAIKEILTLAIKAGGTTIKDFKTPSGDIGYFINNLKVYGKDGLCCSVCGEKSKIIKIKQAGRTTFYCPLCQKS